MNWVRNISRNVRGNLQSEVCQEERIVGAASFSLCCFANGRFGSSAEIIAQTRRPSQFGQKHTFRWAGGAQCWIGISVWFSLLEEQADGTWHHESAAALFQRVNRRTKYTMNHSNKNNPPTYPSSHCLASNSQNQAIVRAHKSKMVSIDTASSRMTTLGQ